MWESIAAERRCPCSTVGSTAWTSWPGRHGAPRTLAAGMRLRCVSVSTQSAFDTHDSQVKTLNAGLEKARVEHFGLQDGLQAPSGPVERRQEMPANGYIHRNCEWSIDFARDISLSYSRNLREGIMTRTSTEKPPSMVEKGQGCR